MTSFKFYLQPTVLKKAAIASAGFFILAWSSIVFTREANGLSSIWPATALTFAILLKSDKREWPLLLAATIFGKIMANVVCGDPLSRIAATSMITLAQMTACAFIMALLVKEKFDFSHHRHLMMFAAVSVAVPIPFSLLAGAYFNAVMQKNYIDTSLAWYLTGTLGFIIFTPLFFIVGKGQLKSLMSEDKLPKLIGVSSALVLVLSMVFLQQSYPLLFLVFPVLALSAFWLGTPGAIAALSLTTFFSIFCTMQGLGPINLVHGGAFEKSLVLQGFLTTAALISLPIASALSYRTQLEKEAQEGRLLAENANLAKSQFLTSMSHELRTPLNAILGFSQLMLMDSALSDKARDHVNYIMTGGEHLLKLVGDVLDLAKIEAGAVSINKEVINCELLLDEVIEMVRPLAKKRYVKIEKAYMPDIYLTADRARLTQVMYNLLSNAIKYNHTHGYVMVATEILDGSVRIKVADSGHGISNEMQDKVFEPFNRLGVENSNIEGTGIGLAISKQLTEAMQGKMSFSSVEAEGSIFYVELPMAESVALREAAEETPIAIATEKTGTRILYIEDNLANAELMRHVVHNMMKADIMVVRDGKTGLRQAKDFAPDIIISDIHLPDMSGNEILKSLREHPLTCKIPVMALTADATFANKKEAKAFDRVMSKPFQLKELVENLGSFLPAVA